MSNGVEYKRVMIETDVEMLEEAYTLAQSKTLVEYSGDPLIMSSNCMDAMQIKLNKVSELIQSACGGSLKDRTNFDMGNNNE